MDVVGATTYLTPVFWTISSAVMDLVTDICAESGKRGWNSSQLDLSVSALEV